VRAVLDRTPSVLGIRATCYFGPTGASCVIGKMMITIPVMPPSMTKTPAAAVTQPP
jgi:hypothetical protein